MVLRKKCLNDVKTSRGNKKKVIPEFYGKQNFNGIFLFNLIRRSLEFFRVSRKNRDDVFGYSYAKVLALALASCLGAVSESWAANCNLVGTKLVVSGSGKLVAADCPSGWSDTATEVEIKEGITEIGDWVFSRASKIEKVSMPKTITRIGDYAFFQTTGLKSLTIPNSVTTIGGYAFGGSGAQGALVIPDSVTTIGGFAFFGMYGITDLSIGNSVSTIGGAAFFNMRNVKNLNIPDSVTSIGGGAFEGMINLTSLTIPDNVTSIGTQAFRSMWNISSLTLPDSLTSTGFKLFDYMWNLKELIIPDNLVPSDDWDANLFLGLPAGATIYCQGELDICKANFAKYLPKADGECPDGVACLKNTNFVKAEKAQCTGKYTWDETLENKCRRMTESECNNSDKYYFVDGKCSNLPRSKTACSEEDFLWVKNSCKKSCPSGKVYYKEDCLDEYPFAKKHYTPAEAAQWLNEDNNTITLTFKK